MRLRNNGTGDDISVFKVVNGNKHKTTGKGGRKEGRKEGREGGKSKRSAQGGGLTKKVGSYRQHKR